MHCLFILLSNAVRWATFRLSIIITSAASTVCSRGDGGGGGGGASWVCDCVFPVNKTKLHTIWHALNETAHLKYQNVQP